MGRQDDNFIMTKTISGICINTQDWFYEGQIVDIIDKRFGALKNVVITFISDAGDKMTVTDSNKKMYFLDPRILTDISLVERRRAVMSL